jgi:hypothetical protein
LTVVVRIRLASVRRFGIRFFVYNLGIVKVAGDYLLLQQNFELSSALSRVVQCSLKSEQSPSSVHGVTGGAPSTGHLPLVSDGLFGVSGLSFLSPPGSCKYIMKLKMTYSNICRRPQRPSNPNHSLSNVPSFRYNLELFELVNYAKSLKSSKFLPTNLLTKARSPSGHCFFSLSSGPSSGVSVSGFSSSGFLSPPKID